MIIISVVSNALENVMKDKADIAVRLGQHEATQNILRGKIAGGDVIVRQLLEANGTK